MPEEKDNIVSKNPPIRLPDELTAELRKAQSVYQARGEKAPSYGVLLLRAWAAYKSEEAHARSTTTPKPVITLVPAENLPAQSTEFGVILSALAGIATNQEMILALLKGPDGKVAPVVATSPDDFDRSMAAAQKEAARIGRTAQGSGKSRRGVAK